MAYSIFYVNQLLMCHCLIAFFVIHFSPLADMIFILFIVYSKFFRYYVFGLCLAGIRVQHKKSLAENSFGLQWAAIAFLLAHEACFHFLCLRLECTAVSDLRGSPLDPLQLHRNIITEHSECDAILHSRLLLNKSSKTVITVECSCAYSPPLCRYIALYP